MNRRCGGTLSTSNAFDGTRTPLTSCTTVASAAAIDVPSSQASGRPSRAATAATTSFIGVSSRRCSFGSERTSASTNSSRNPATPQSNPVCSTWFSAASGTCTVAPSSAEPGSKR